MLGTRIVCPLMFCFIAAVSAPVLAGELTFDMGGAKTQTLPVSEGAITLLVINRLPKKNYSLEEIRIENITVDNLIPPSNIGVPFPAVGKQKTENNLEGICVPLDGLIEKLELEKLTEQDLAGLRKEWAAVKAELKDKQCPAQVKKGDTLLRASEKNYGTHILKSGQRLVLTIKGGKDETWTFIASTQSRGSWVGSWGVAIIPNKDRSYYANPNGGGAYTVTEKHDNDSVDLVPAVFYSWLPTGKETKDCVWSPVGGIGLDNSNLTLFFGLGFIYNRNLSVFFGPVAHKQRRLKGEFTTGQTISDPLTSDALTETVYKINGFVSIGLRF